MLSHLLILLSLFHCFIHFTNKSAERKNVNTESSSNYSVSSSISSDTSEQDKNNSEVEGYTFEAEYSQCELVNHSNRRINFLLKTTKIQVDRKTYRGAVVTSVFLFLLL